MKIKHIFLALAVTVSSLSSCSDILDVAPDGKISLDEVWVDPDKVGAFLNSCYNNIPPKNISYFFFERILDAASDDAWTAADGEGQAIQQFYNGSSSASSHPLRDWDHHSNGSGAYWDRYFTQIRLCTQFIENIDKAAVRSESERARWKAEAHVMRAYFYSELVKWFGKVPIERKSYSFDQDFSGEKRESVPDVAAFIEEDCDIAINTPELPWRISTNEEARRATKALAYAVKSKMWLFAASPLYNEGANLWEKAYEVNKKAVEELKKNGYALYTVCSNPARYGTGKAAAYHQLLTTSFQYSGDPADKETIWEGNQGSASFSWHVNYMGHLPNMFKCGICPSQELVDAYETIDGQPILDLSKPYLDDKHTQPNYNRSNTMYDENDPYKNRDPRFDVSVVHNESVIQIDGADLVIETYIGGRDEIKPAIKEEKFTRTGYYHKKMVVPGTGGNTQINNANHKHFRLAEIILDYAEAAAEAGHLEEARIAANETRARVGMPGLPENLSQAELILRIRNERRIELVFEENRYYDLRRWQKPDGDLSATCKWITAMEITKQPDGSFKYKRRPVRDTPRYGYENKDLLLPLPISEAANMEILTGEKWQNPGW